MRLPKGLDIQFFKDGTGEFSLMRLVVYQGVQLARLIVVEGLVLIPFELFHLHATGTTVGVVLVGIGTAMFGLGEGAKALQSKFEGGGAP